MASRFTFSAHTGHIELVSTSRIPHNMHIFGLSAIHCSFIVVCEVVTGYGTDVKNTCKEHTMTEHTTAPAALSPQQLEQLWAEHLKGEFETKDVEATLETMVEDAYVNH